MMKIKSLERICDNCGKEFKPKDNINQVKGNELVCDECFKEYYQLCPMCQEYEHEDNMIDTEGKINGGIGYVCEECGRDI